MFDREEADHILVLHHEEFAKDWIELNLVDRR